MTTTETQLIADALWGIAAAITESKPKPVEYHVTQNITDEEIADGEAIAFALRGSEPIVMPKTDQEIEKELEALPVGAYAVLDHPVEIGGMAYIAEGEFARRFERTGFLTDFAVPNGKGAGGKWWLHATHLRQLGLTAADFEVPQDESLSRPLADWEEELLAGSEPEGEDVVNEPSHYTQEDGLECIDFAFDLTGPWFSVVRYVWRCMDKGNPVQDLNKALRYIDIAEEKGLDKPGNPERTQVLSDLWWDAAAGSVEEQRYLTLTSIFEEGDDVDDTRHQIKELLTFFQEGDAPS